MDKLRASFKAYFDVEGLELLPSLPPQGKLRGGGWVVSYVLNPDLGQIDFFAQNRHTDSRHVRILASGEVIPLENYQDVLIFDAETGEDWGKAAAQQHQHNQNVTQILTAKGLI